MKNHGYVLGNPWTILTQQVKGLSGHSPCGQNASFLCEPMELVTVTFHIHEVIYSEGMEQKYIFTLHLHCVVRIFDCSLLCNISIRKGRIGKM